MARFQFLAGIDTPGAAYGDDTYGGNITYGQQASDDIGLGPFIAFPLLFGGPAPIGWNYRVGDTEPELELLVMSRGTDLRMNPAAVMAAQLVLDRIMGEDHQIVLPLVTGTVFTHNLLPGDFDEPGVYRATVQLIMQSLRSFTVPFDDRLGLTVYPAEVA